MAATTAAAASRNGAWSSTIRTAVCGGGGLTAEGYGAAGFPRRGSGPAGRGVARPRQRVRLALPLPGSRREQACHVVPPLPTLPQGAPVTISFTSLTKRYRGVTAVDDLSVDVQPGRITAFLGPNGSGKTTSMRALLGLTVPTAGTATIDGRRYRDVPHPMRVVGAVLDQGLHPNRTARRHLRILALQAGAPPGRVDEMLELVGLTQTAARRVGGYSLGMRQRLGSPTHCSATRRSWCSTSPSTASIRKASAGCATCCAPSPTAAAPCCCPATCWPRSRTPPTTP